MEIQPTKRRSIKREENGISSLKIFAKKDCKMIIVNNKSNNMKIIVMGAGFLGFLGVGMGAFGAHALHERLVDRGMMDVWEIAVNYQLIHAVALLALAAWMTARFGVGAGESRNGERRVERCLSWAGCCWVVGVALFSGSLYVLALGGPGWVGVATPLGGLGLLAGWGLVAVEGWRMKGTSGNILGG